MEAAKIIQFLTQLSENNDRDWFNSNKDQYQQALNEFKEITAQVIKGISVIDKRIGLLEPADCLFRIYRDTRFSNNKLPYKTNFGAYIAPGGRKSRYAGYYMHIEPSNSMLAGGIYMPDGETLKTLRQEIYDNVDEYLSIIQSDRFKKTFGEVGEDKLKSAPRGFPSDWPHIELLKYKHFAVGHSVKDQYWDRNDFIPESLKVFEIMFPFNEFLNKALD